MSDQVIRPKPVLSESDENPVEGHAPGMPSWVKVSLIIVASLILLFVILHLTGVMKVSHGPGPQMPITNTH